MSRLIASPDGRHIYATSYSGDRLVVLTAGFKGIGHPDTDSDGVPDKDDAFPFDPSEWADTDADGVGDNSDAFPNDSSEWADFDGDELGDNSDPDIDGDGCENSEDHFDFDPTECLDTDGDGVGNNADIDDDGDRLPPKAVFGLAATRALGFEVRPEHFSAGHSQSCFRILRRAG